ncbi:flagellar brake protein [Kaarinaea lacus]
MDNRDYHIEYQPQYETIEKPQRIFSLLKPAIGSETSLKIVPDHSDELFQSSLLNIDYERKLLSIKKINYTFGHLMVIDAKSLTIYSQHDGAEVAFTTYLSRYSERNGGYYEIQFPQQVKYCQRRMSHRVHISFALNIRAELYTEKGQKVEAYLRDISAEGLRLQISEVNPNEFKEKAIIKNCVINLPDSEQINCTLQVQHKHNHVRNKGCTIGGSFFAMSAAQQKDIQKFISGLERRLLREVRL